MTFYGTGERYVRHRGGEGSPTMNAPFLTMRKGSGIGEVIYCNRNVIGRVYLTGTACPFAFPVPI